MAPPAPVNAQLSIAKDTVVCSEAELVGDITIGAGTVVHPKARIIAQDGPIVIGNNNLIEEQVEIINRKKENETGNEKVLIVGNGNSFEVGARCESLQVGDNNTLESRAHVGRDVVITDNCIIGMTCRLTSEETLPPNTVVSGEDHTRRVQSDPAQTETLQLEFLRKILPNYHLLTKSKS